ncbi:MAG: hypothetical protein JST39_09140, partial [Bacteroidetes bacterium]|nr:hypothetical protein [Bacteroidota bacterium]
MKKIILALFLLPILAQGQNAYTVSNIPGVRANYYTLQGAIDSVAAGSVLYVFPSVTDYGNIVLRKKMTIYGTGFMLDQNGPPYTSPNQYGVSISSLFIGPGADNSYIEGLQLTGTTPHPDLNNYYRFFLDSVNNVTISRCIADIWPTFPFNNVIAETINTFNCSFNGCYLALTNFDNPNHSGGGFFVEGGDGSTNLQFNNNIIDSRGYDVKMVMARAVNYGDIRFTNNTFSIGLHGTNFGNAT